MEIWQQAVLVNCQSTSHGECNRNVAIHLSFLPSSHLLFPASFPVFLSSNPLRESFVIYPCLALSSCQSSCLSLSSCQDYKHATRPGSLLDTFFPATAISYAISQGKTISLLADYYTISESIFSSVHTSFLPHQPHRSHRSFQSTTVSSHYHCFT